MMQNLRKGEFIIGDTGGTIQTSVLSPSEPEHRIYVAIETKKPRQHIYKFRGKLVTLPSILRRRLQITCALRTVKTRFN